MSKEIINIPPPDSGGVIVNFFWEETSGPEEIEFSGDTENKWKFPQNTLELPVVFIATKKAAEETKPEWTKEPHIVLPPGTVIDTYVWSFGDGTEESGSSLEKVSHLYKVGDPDMKVTLTVVDSHNNRWSCARPISMIYKPRGALAAYRIRNQIEGGHAYVQSVTDKARAVDTATFAINVKKYAEALADKILSADKPKAVKFNHVSVSDKGIDSDSILPIKSLKRTLSDFSYALDSTGSALKPITEALPVEFAESYFGGLFVARSVEREKAPTGFSVLDPFAGDLPEENPVANSKWTKTFNAYSTGEININGYQSNGNFSKGVASMYWNEKTYSEPTVSINVPRIGTTVKDYVVLYSCLNSPTLEEWTGYTLRAIKNSLGTKETTLQLGYHEGKMSEVSILAESLPMIYATTATIAMKLKSGYLSAWYKEGEGYPWKEIINVAVSGKPTSGYIGVGARGSSWSVSNFSVSTS